MPLSAIPQFVGSWLVGGCSGSQCAESDICEASGWAAHHRLAGIHHVVLLLRSHFERWSGDDLDLIEA